MGLWARVVFAQSEAIRGNRWRWTFALSRRFALFSDDVFRSLSRRYLSIYRPDAYSRAERDVSSCPPLSPPSLSSSPSRTRLKPWIFIVPILRICWDESRFLNTVFASLRRRIGDSYNLPVDKTCVQPKKSYDSRITNFST